MRQKLFYLLSTLIFILHFSANAQKHSVKIGTDIPLQYALGYDFQVHHKATAGVKMGILTTPYDDILLGLFELMGGSERILDVIKDGFHNGLIFELGGNYYFKGNQFFGLSGQYIDLRASEARADAIETLLNIDFSNFPIPLNNIAPDDIIYVNSQLYQLVIRYGWEKQMKNPRFKIRLEVSLSINLSSRSRIKSDLYDISEISDDVNNSLRDFYHQYAYIPTFGIYFVYTLGKIPKQD